MKQKAQQQMFWLMIAIIVILIGAVLYLFIFRNIFQQEKNTLDNIILGTKDYDGDGTIDMLDKCVCVVGVPTNNGCPKDLEIPKDKFKGCSKGDLESLGHNGS